jgi:hypothetical protein
MSTSKSSASFTFVDNVDGVIGNCAGHYRDQIVVKMENQMMRKTMIVMISRRESPGVARKRISV